MKRKVLNKLLALLLVFAMLAPITGYLETNANEVQAEESSNSGGYVIVPSSAVTTITPTDTTQPKIMSVKADDSEYGQYADYIFAGWYTNAAATTPAASGTTGEFARFVPAGVLSTKVQVTNGIVTTNNNYHNKYVMRFVSSVDSKDYQYAGFELSYTDKETKECVTLISKTKKVFTHIDSTTGVIDNNMDTYEFSSKVVDTKSTYFITSKLPVAPEDIDVNYTVKAYWVTKDGTKVYGQERCVSVNDGIKTDRLNLTVDGELTVGGNYSVSYNKRDNSPVTGAKVEVLTSGKGHSNVRITNATQDTKSVTTVTILDGNGTVATGLYRNWYVQYKNIPDTTWYDMYSDEDEFTIASTADLYGFGTAVNRGVTFEDKTVYLVADVAVNKGNATKDGWSIEDVSGGTAFKWTTIGKYQYPFRGTFDGCMHTISGVYSSGNIARNGLFGLVKSGTIKNFKLVNSYFDTTSERMGSIVGEISTGTLHTIYSDAFVNNITNNTTPYTGGLIGLINDKTNVNIVNCWYDGTVTSNNKIRTVGGLVGCSTVTTLNIQNSMFTGVVDVPAGVSLSSPQGVGGLIGVHDQGTTNISNTILDPAGNFSLNANLISGAKNSGSLNTTNLYYDEKFGNYPYWSAAINTKNLIKMTADANYSSLLEVTAYWENVNKAYPILKSFADTRIIVPDTSWYTGHENDLTYILYDAEDLYGLAEISKTYNFAGKTIRLDADVVINKGDANEWAEAAPRYTWSPIGSEGEGVVNHFAGTFDGGMHTISGIYHVTSAKYSGLFGGTASSATIQNLKLKNSYFKSTASSSHLGSIVGGASGKIDTVYSDAIVVANKYAGGGLVGSFNGNHDTNIMNNCWFAGSVTGYYSSYGGVLGYVATGGKVAMSNCLNTGTVKAISASNNCVAGLIGSSDSSIVSTIKNSLNLGLIQQDASKSSGYGPIAGNAASKYSVSNTYATTESSKGDPISLGTKYAEQDLIGDAAATKLANFDFDNIWATVSYETPVLKSFINEDDGRIDASWYDADAPEYTLYDEQDLYGFAMISKIEDFADKTVKLGADIVVNEGTASADWGTKSHYRQWFSVGYAATPNKFAGTFDGQGHTISGLYMNTANRYAGLFAATASTSTIQNLKLVNSYIKSSHRDIGGVVGLAYGDLYRIYCDVIVEAKNNEIGGMIGQAAGTNQEIASCWFAGTVKNTSASLKDTGAFIGGAYAPSLKIYNCLNTGVVDVTAYNTVAGGYVAPKAGGFVGNVGNSLAMHQCVSLGEMLLHETANNAYGPFVGYSSYNVNVVMSACYTTMDLGDYNIVAHNNLAANYDVVSVEDVLADAETQKSTMPNLSWGTNWIAGDKVNPSIKFDYAISGSGVDYTANEQDLAVLSNQYNRRALYQGEMHDHAKTYGRGQDVEIIGGISIPRKGDDGKVDLETWETQMDTLGLDFAASLDHNQIDHYGLLDHSKFIYGSEAEATIYEDDGAYIGELHFDMIFKSQAEFEAFISEHEDNFKYNTVQSSNLFSYDGFVFKKSEFKQFIRDIIEAGGVFNLPHPLQNENYDTTALENLYFEVIDESRKQLIYGFQVINDVRGAASTTRNLKSWKELLARGYRLYATAGSDSHGDLRNESLTSIYATTHDGTKCNGSCNIADCAGYDKGNMISQLQSGDYAAGNVAIQMCIYEGDNATSMGGSCDFTGNKRLVISMGNILKTDTLKEGHTYRVDVLNEKGVVYSQYIDPFKTTTIALDVQDCGFYRVEIYDINHATSSKHTDTDLDKYPTGLIAAAGNPIWNDNYVWEQQLMR